MTVVNDTAHERRFDPLPSNGLPTISSKNKIKLSHVDMNRGNGRHQPIFNSSLWDKHYHSRAPMVDRIYDIDLDAVMKTKLSKNTLFPQADRWSGSGEICIGKSAKDPLESSVNVDKVHLSCLSGIKPTIVEQRPFEKYVDKDITMF